MPEQSDQKPRIFLCHASEDKPQVAELYQQLKDAGYHPWLDKFDLLPGQHWRREIEKIIRDPYNLILVCLSNNSVTKRGVVQQEMKWALDILDQMPEDTIYLIPVRLEACQAPERLSELHWVNLFERDGFEYLKRALDFEIKKRQPELKPEPVDLPQTLSRRQPFEPETILIPAGEFLMGTDPQKDKIFVEAKKNYKDNKYITAALNSEQPQHRLYLPDYYMAKTPVTNAQYAAFVQATGYQTQAEKAGSSWVWKDAEWKEVKGANWQHPTGPSSNINQKSDHPVVQVSWNDAVAYCEWLAQVTGKQYRLPSEAEWEKAARGADGRIYPWGNEWEAQRCNTSEGGPGDTTPVGQYSPDGDSPYGAADMAGNVREWTLSLWGADVEKPDFKYPYQADDGREELKASDEIFRVLRGGSFLDQQLGARCAFRGGVWFDFRFNLGGCRVAVSPI